MNEKEREILRLMYDLQVEMHRSQGNQILGLRQAADGCTRAIEGLEKAHEILGRLMKATSELIGVQ
ncbi:MAG TPA: hypothetical protein VKE96_12495 [Vicinamibacterales bacterium]|nr:hypothetical protein [Vicinamibacterales bacterium]